MSTSIINLDQVVSMTTLEIAELTGKEHKHVMRDVRNIVEELNGSKNGLVEISYKDTKGEARRAYQLDRKHVFVLVAGYSVQLRAKCYDHIQALESKVLHLEDQKKRAAVQSANRRGVTWGDFCKTVGLPAQKMLTALRKDRSLLRWSKDNSVSVNPRFDDCFMVIKPSDQRFSPKGINFRFNAKGLEYFSHPDRVTRFKDVLVSQTGSDDQKRIHLLGTAKSDKNGGPE
ncbi:MULTISPECIES: Rha family transcriptional regulator [Serratia]|uniref:Rha family transcriptional regulator n=1 Tax=Serratia TaxID=613 RepID=UPI001495EEE6|nr:Rha family transcriptional regulator [Serratia marcescens]